MEKRLEKIKDEFFENIDSKKANIYFFIIGCIYVFSVCFIIKVINNQPNRINGLEIIFFLMFFFCYTFAMGILAYSIYYKVRKNMDFEIQQKINEMNRLAHMKELEKQYENFVELLNKVLKEIFGEIDETKVSHEFLAELEEYENEYNSVLPQSFTEAACLFISLLKCPIVKTSSKNEDELKEILGLNVRIALSCSLQMIMNPFTAYINLNGEICKDFYDKVIMLFPDGNSLDGKEGQKLLNGVFNDIIKFKGTHSIGYYDMLFRKIYMHGYKR